MVDGELVLKVLVRPPGEHKGDPAEALAYASGAFVGLPPGLRAPTSYGNVAIGTEHVGIWLELERDDPDIAWDGARFAIATRHLGRFAVTNDARLRALAGSRPRRSFWVNHRLISSTLQTFRDIPIGHLADRVWSPALRAELVAIQDQRELQVAHLNDLPITVCHGDAQRRNLFAEQRGTVAIDWANAGTAMVGMDLSTLVYYGLAYFDLDIGDRASLEREMVDAYAQGLVDGGADISREEVWLGFAGHLVYGLGLLESASVLHMLLEPEYARRMEEMCDKPLDAIIERRAELAEYVLDLGLRLADAVGR
jgi:hypothetical protein